MSYEQPQVSLFEKMQKEGGMMFIPHAIEQLNNEADIQNFLNGWKVHIMNENTISESDAKIEMKDLLDMMIDSIPDNKNTRLWKENCKDL